MQSIPAVWRRSVPCHRSYAIASAKPPFCFRIAPRRLCHTDVIGPPVAVKTSGFPPSSLSTKSLTSGPSTLTWRAFVTAVLAVRTFHALVVLTLGRCLAGDAETCCFHNWLACPSANAAISVFLARQKHNACTCFWTTSDLIPSRAPGPLLGHNLTALARNTDPAWANAATMTLDAQTPRW